MATRRRIAVYNVLDYGADPTSLADSSPGIQAAIDAATAGLVGVPGVDNGYAAIVEIPAGLYRLFTPIQITSNYITIRGAGQGYTKIAPTFAGQCWYMGPAIPIPLVSGITVSGGSALSLTGEVNPYAISLRDMSAGDIDGIGSFTIECFYQTTALGPSDPANFVSVSGSRTFGEPFVTQLSITQAASGAISAQLKTSVSTYSVSTAAFGIGVTLHLALSWDGSTLRIFRAGNLEASAATAGTFTMNPYDDFVIGYRPAVWPMLGVVNYAVKATVDSFRLSNGALYTANFTPPTAKLGTTGATRLLLNFTSNIGPFTNASSTIAGAANGYVIHFPQNTLALSRAYTNLEGLYFSGNSGRTHGPFIRSTQNSHYRGLQVEGSRSGLQIFDNCYQLEVSDLYAIVQNDQFLVTGLTRFGLSFAGACGILLVSRIHITGGSYPALFCNAGGQIDQFFVETQVQTQWAFAFTNDAGGAAGGLVNELVINNESGGQPIIYGVFIGNCENIQFNGGTQFYFGALGCQAAFAVNGGGTVMVLAHAFDMAATIPEMLHVINPTAKPVLFLNSYNPNNVPLSLTPTQAIEWPGPIPDTNALVKGSVDATKQVRLEVDGFTTGTTRVLTPPDANITIAGVNLAQTWTQNQTLGDDLLRATSPRISNDISDANGNAAIGLGATGGAVNNIATTNAATGNAPILEATGSDTDVSLTVRGKGSAGRILLTSAETITSNSATALSAGRQGTTNPGINVDASAASCVTGLNVQSLASGAGCKVTVTSSATDESFLLNAKGTGSVGFQANRALISPTGKVQSVAGTGATPTTGTITHAGALYGNTSVVGNVGGGEDDLHSTTIEANTFGENNDSAEFIIGGNWTAVASTRSARLYYAGSLIVAITSASADQKWIIKGSMMRVDATNMRFIFEAHLSPAGAAGPPTQFFARELTVSATHSSANIFKCTGESSAAGNNEVTQTVTRIWKASAA